MRVINLFDNALGAMGPNGARAARVRRAGSLLHKAMRGGAGVTPAAAWIIAAEAVQDAVRAYCRHRQARETTRVLEAECEKLQRLIKDELKKAGIQVEKLEKQHELRQITLEEHFRANREAAERMQNAIAGNQTILENLIAQTEALRQSQSNPTQKFIELETAVHLLMNQQLICLLDNISE